MRKALLVASLALIVVSSATPARAQGYLAPFIGWDFGGDAGNCPSIVNDCSEKKTSYGVTVGALAGGIFGIEEDIGYAPDFFGKSVMYGDNSVFSAMTNLVVSIPIGGVRPYGSGGLGLLRTYAPLSSFGSSQSQNLFGYDLGGGLMLLFPHHLGMRGDYRYFKSISTADLFGISLGSSTKLSFSRVSVALVIH